MRALVSPLALSLGFLVSGLLTSQAAMAQGAPGGYPAQPGYQQPQPYPQQGYPQQYPQQPGYQQPQQPQPYPQQYPDQYQQPQQYPQQYPQPQPQPQPQPYPDQYQQPQPYPDQYQQPQPYPQQYQQPQQYPQQYQQPQPAYQPPPAYVEPPRHRGFMTLPYLGLTIPAGDAGDAYSTHLRLGGLFGFFAGPFVSLNGELSIDIESPKNLGTGVSALGALLGLSFSPLIHFGSPRLDIVVGPRLGFFEDSITYSYNDGGADDTYSGSGYLLGINTGAFFSLGRISLGGLLSITHHTFTQMCTNGSCGDPAPGHLDPWLVGLNAAMMY